MLSRASIQYSYNAGIISGSSDVGGIATHLETSGGVNLNPSVRYSYNLGQIIGSSYVGAIASRQGSGSISRNYYETGTADYGVGTYRKWRE